MNTLRNASGYVLIIALVTAGCAGSGATTDTATAGAGVSTRDIQELEALYRQRQQADLQRFVQADVDFMTGMISHHAQALVMSRLAPSNGASERVSVLCARIINSQADEIAWMQKWLRDRGQAVPEVSPDGTMPMAMGMMHGDHAMHMPGMLTPEQMTELKAAQGTKFDELFLRYMIQHHNGALIMARELFAAGGAGRDEATYKLASDIQADQASEIGRMEGMLKLITDSTP